MPHMKALDQHVEPKKQAGIKISASSIGQTECIWLVGISTFRCLILDHNVVLSQLQ